MSANPHATGLGRGHHLGAGDACAVVRCRSAAALFNLRHSPRDRVYPHRDQFWLKTIPTAADHCLHASRHRQTGFRLGDQPIIDRHRVRGLVGKGIQGAEHADRAGVSTRYGCA